LIFFNSCAIILSHSKNHIKENDMRIKKLQISPDILDEHAIPADKNLCCIVGRNSFEILDTVRLLLGESMLKKSSNGLAVYADVEIDRKDFSVCCICSEGYVKTAVNFDPYSTTFSFDDTKEYVSKTEFRNKDGGNVLNAHTTLHNDLYLSESDSLMHLIDEIVIKNRKSDDDRPIFIYGIFERLDNASDTSSLLHKLNSLNRQIFIAIEDTELPQRLNFPFVCTIYANTLSKAPWQRLNIGDTYDGFYTVIKCPVCGNKTLDNYWICPHCAWEYDGHSENEYSSCNQTTLNRYREQHGKDKDNV